jgi:hypothetical protein
MFHLAVPLLYPPGYLLPITCLHLVVRQSFREGFYCYTRVADEREPRVFGGVEVRDVDVHEPDIRVLKCRLRGGREIRVAGADADHEVRFLCGAVGAARSRDPYSAQTRRVVVGQRSLARLRLGDGDTGALHELPQGVGSLGVDHAAPGDYQRAAGTPDERGGLFQGLVVGARAPYGPYAAFEEFLREVVGLSLNVLG